MVTTLYICDRCGKVIPDDYDSSTAIPMFDNEGEFGVRVDLCKSCTDELDSLLKTHFFELNDDNLVMKDAPYAEIAVLETLVEDQTKEIEKLEEELVRLKVMKYAPHAEIEGLEALVEDQLKEIEELEEELERLRDVKDKLFETNFKLTAQLRALGIEVEDGE